MLSELTFEPDYAFPPDEVTELFTLASEKARRFTELDSSDRVPLLVTSDPGPAWSILRAAEGLPRQGRRFCEWGSGTGAITCLAAQLGWDATGFDCEPGLVQVAQSLAAEVGVDAVFGLGDYSLAPDEPRSPGMIDPFAADVVFAYAWPAELRWLPDRFAASAAPGTVLILYHGGITVRAFRQS